MSLFKSRANYQPPPETLLFDNQYHQVSYHFLADRDKVRKLLALDISKDLLCSVIDWEEPRDIVIYKPWVITLSPYKIPASTLNAARVGILVYFAISVPRSELPFTHLFDAQELNITDQPDEFYEFGLHGAKCLQLMPDVCT